MSRSRGKGGKGHSRRDFLRQIGVLAGVGVVAERRTTRAGPFFQDTPTSDEEICRAKFDLATRESLGERPIGEIMVAIGTSFLGTPYEAKTLETNEPEDLVVNLRSLDCVTFVESTLALSRCIRLRAHDFKEYSNQLRLIRYRKGTIDGYASRLHYFSDWILDNARKGIVTDSSQLLGGVPYTGKTRFMSEHRDSYQQLADDSVFEAIRGVEKALNSQERYYLPKESVGQKNKIQQGDIIGITTSIDGLDISHTGLAVEMNGVIKYLHAPLSGGSVQISEESLSAYLQKNSGRTGIMVARPVEPV